MKLHILADTGEKNPWDFPLDRVTKANLRPKGMDYTVQGYSSILGIERKMWDDYLGRIATPGAREKFVRDQIRPLSKLDKGIVIVEGCIGDPIRFTRLSMQRVVIITAQLEARYGVPILFFRSRELAMLGARAWLIEARNALRR